MTETEFSIVGRVADVIEDQIRQIYAERIANEVYLTEKELVDITAERLIEVSADESILPEGANLDDEDQGMVEYLVLQALLDVTLSEIELEDIN